MPEPIIKVEHLSKLYHIGAKERYRTFRGAMADLAASPLKRLRRFGRASHRDSDTIWALKDVSFEVRPGEVVGIIGRNGAGKSTLLKILCRVTEPTEGRAVLNGRVGSLLEVGTGFHSELTGRENIYLSGAILGMSRREIKSRFDEIVDFSGIEKFLDTPVKRYSSGMRVRLGFAVAAHLEPEILLVDEVLAVGDVAFQKKCLGKMRDVAQGGRTVLLVSHNMAAIEGLCQQGIVLEGGSVSFSGRSEEAVQRYVRSASCSSRNAPLSSHANREGTGALRFTSVRFRSHGRETDTVLTGNPLDIELEYEAASVVKNVSVSVPFFTAGGQSVFMAWTRLVGHDFEMLPPKGKIIVEIPRVPLCEGAYVINLWCEVKGILADWVKGVATVLVVDGDFYGTGSTPPRRHGLVVVDHRFRYEAI